MISLSSGHSAEYLTAAVAQGRESYYTGAVAAGEPPGRWQGRGAAELGLTGEAGGRSVEALFSHFIDPRDERFRRPEAWADAPRLGRAPRDYATAADAVSEALAGEPNATPERRQEIRMSARRRARSPVAFIDATYSVPKSITVVHAAFEAQEVRARRDGNGVAADAWAAHREAVEAAIWAGNAAALEAFQDKAGYSRVGYHSAHSGRWIDAHRFVVASFFQHDSRDHDPQLHIHNAILNRVRCADGEWRTLDSKALHAVRREVASIAERTTEEHLTRALGLTFATRPDGKSREIVGVPQAVIDLFSSRRRAITARTAQLVAAYRRRFDREPTALELDRLQRRATFATRRAKEHVGEGLEQRLDRWDRELRAEVAGGLARVAEDVLQRRRRQPDAAEISPSQVTATALARVQERFSAWRRSDLSAAIADALPDHLGASNDRDVRRLIEGLTEEVLADGRNAREVTAPELADLPAELRLADGRSAYQPPSGPRYATHGHLRAERALQDSTVERGAPALTSEVARRYIDQLATEGLELGADQRHAVEGVLISGALVESLVGPAGTGKSVIVGRLARAWEDPALWDGEPGRMFGLAASQIATEVLAAEGLTARNIARWFATQERLAAGRANPADHAWSLRPGDLVAIDESAMASTPDVVRVAEYVRRAGAKLLLTGDHRQLAAIGSAGAMAIAASSGLAYELADVRRFTAPWERHASLRLREGDVAVLEEYRKRGRIVDGGTLEHAQQAAARAWLADTLAGRESVLIVDTNEQAAVVSAHLRAELVRLGRVVEDGVPLADGTTAGVGDLVQARRNAWGLAGFRGNRRGPVNRETYRIVEVRPDGGVIAERRHGGGQIALPGRYVTRHLTLGYASTVHSAQGRTVDTAHAVISFLTSAAAAYVAMSRGRDGNTAYVCTVQVPEDAPFGQASTVEHRDPLAVMADVVAREQDDQSALQVAAESWRSRQSARTAATRLADAVDLLAARRVAAVLDRLRAGGCLSDEERLRLATEPATAQLGRLHRRAELAGRDLESELAAAIAEQPLAGAESISAVLYARVTRRWADQILPAGDTFAERVPAVEDPAWRRYLETVAEIADQRARELGAETAQAPPPWAREALGPVPAEPVARLPWEERAGRVAVYREMAGHEEEESALGPAPKANQVEQHAAWHAAWRALGRPEAGREEAGMSDGQLLVRIRAYQREEAWAPGYVADELDGTTREAVRQRQDATLLAALAENAAEVERESLQRQAAEAASLADELTRRVEDLTEADAARAQWYVHTAETRAAADRARAELVERDVDPDEPADAIPVGEWLAEHQADVAVEDRHRPIAAEQDLADELRHRVELDRAEWTAGVETAVIDLREVAATEESPAARGDEGGGRLATAEETATAVERAQRALLELRARRAVEKRRSAEEERHLDLTRQVDGAARVAGTDAVAELAD